MKPYMFLLLLGIHKVVTVYHSLKYFYTASSGVSHFPEFVAVVLVDDIEILRYDSRITKATPKQDWVIRVEQDHPLFLQNSTESFRVAEEVYKKNIDIAKQRFNKTEGTHILQMMTGCEWDESDGITYGNLQFGYDGEDFIAFDLRTERWITSRPQAHSTRAKWDRDQEDRAYRKKYLTQTCVEWLRTYLKYGKSVLMRTERPSVSLLQRTPSSPVSCHATGFYPSSAELLWRKDGEEVHEGVTKGEILPNNDGTFQMSSDLDVSSVPAEDWTKYECVFQLSNTADLPTRLEKGIIKTNAGQMTIIIIIVTIIIISTIAALVGIVVFFQCRKKNDKYPPTDEKSQGSSVSSDVSTAEGIPSPTRSTESLISSSADSSTGSDDSNTPLVKRK